MKAARNLAPRMRGRHRAVVIGLIVVLAGCAPSGGGCAPVDETGGPATTESTTTTEPDGSTTTTTEPGGSTTSTTEPDESTTTTEPDGSTTTTTTVPGGGPTVRVDELEVEDCFSPADADTFVDQIRIVECDAPHEMEVFAQYELDGASEYPGGNELTWAAQDECRSRFEEYVGHDYWTSAFDVLTLTPSFSTWDVGDRTVTCLVVAGDGSALTAPARGAQR